MENQKLRRAQFQSLVLVKMVARMISSIHFFLKSCMSRKMTDDAVRRATAGTGSGRMGECLKWLVVLSLWRHSSLCVYTINAFKASSFFLVCYVNLKALCVFTQRITDKYEIDGLRMPIWFSYSVKCDYVGDWVNVLHILWHSITWPNPFYCGIKLKSRKIQFNIV